jgi:hypothetical protein
MDKVQLPIVCVNGPIYSVKWEPSSDVRNFTEIPCCLTSIRKHGWPGKAYDGLLMPRPEVPAIVTNPANLQSVLELGHGWSQEIRRILTTESPEIFDSWPLEASLYHQALRISGQNTLPHNYRSDLDVTD